MLIEHDGGSVECKSHDEVRAALALRNVENENEFWCYLDAEYPCIGMLVKENIAYVHYFAEASTAGFRAINDTGNIDDTIHFSAGYHYDISGDGIIPLEDGIQAILAFFECHSRPRHLVWDEL